MLAAIDGIFEVIVNVLHDDDRMHAKGTAEKVLSCLAIDFITLPFQLMYFQQMILDVPGSLDRGHQLHPTPGSSAE